MKRNLPDSRDIETDFVSIASGHIKQLSMDYGSDVAILNLVTHARDALRYFEERIGLKMEIIGDCPDYYYGHSDDGVAFGRVLEPVPFPAETLGEWQHKSRLSPHMPYGMTHADISKGGGVSNMAKWDFEVMGNRLMRDERCLGPGLAACFVKGVIDRDIPRYTGTSAEALISDGERIIGVRAVRDGREINIKARRGVLVAVSSYERNQPFSQRLSQQLSLASMVFSSADGGHFRLAGPFGAQVASTRYHRAGLQCPRRRERRRRRPDAKRPLQCARHDLRLAGHAIRGRRPQRTVGRNHGKNGPVGRPGAEG